MRSVYCRGATGFWLLMSSFAAVSGFQEGLQAAKQGDSETALAEWRPLAEQGDAGAQFNLGVMYDNGRGVPEDDQEAARWFRMAARQGFAKAQFNLGVMYAKGEGVPEDYVFAYMWLNLAVASGDKDATKIRDLISLEMTDFQIEEAQRLSR
ncbi:MAG: sel1 repeat family protein [Gammaproteobacteria bacterium]|uniref:Sel1 repeat family protein n=1 Tax=Candidatus Thiopontia autotrophica TaxID=2841688 RepID=A0A8J6NXD2_9GAMM|nr:sel1 repeat family protein [Candidatus Thiopontia autotrophica]